MSISHFSMLSNEFLIKDPYVVLEQAPLMILEGKLALCMANKGNDIKHTIIIDIRMHFVRNVEECNFHNTVWCWGGLKFAEIGTENVSKYELNTILVYAIVRLDQ